MTTKQKTLLRKCWDDQPLTEQEKLDVFSLPFAERSSLSMRAYARRKAVEAGRSADDWRHPIAD